MSTCRFESLPSRASHVSRHSGVVCLYVSGHRRPGALFHPLVVAVSVESQLAQDGAVLGDHLEVGSGDEKSHRQPLVLVADVEVTESTQVTHGHATTAVELV